jgi:hypothetical protein
MTVPIEVRTAHLVGLENVRDAPAHRRNNNPDALAPTKTG